MKKICQDKVVFNFSPTAEGVISIYSGERIMVEVNDCFFQQISSEKQVLKEINYDRLNPATGPIYINNADPGDLLQVKIIDININNSGIVAVVNGEGVLGNLVKKPIIKPININNGYAFFKEIKIPVKPMIGVIGVAPDDDSGVWPTESPWNHGGNMDTSDIQKGSVLYLPIYQKGALLALGDCHGIMGDGEICFTGLEVQAEVTIEVNVIKNKIVKWPLLEANGYTMIISSGDNIEKAIYEATEQAVLYLKNSLNLEWEEAYALASLVVDIKISQLVNPKITVRAAIPNYIVKTAKLIESI